MTPSAFLEYLRKDFLQVETEETPELLRARLSALIAEIAPDKTTDTWPACVDAYRTDIHERILQGQLGSRDAAGALLSNRTRRRLFLP